MGRRKRLINDFTGPRYAHFLAYAQLLTGDTHRADALVGYALRRTFGGLRRLGTDEEVEARMRELIVTRFLDTAGPADDVAEMLAHSNSEVVDVEHTVEESTVTHQSSAGMNQGSIEDLAQYAPPGMGDAGYVTHSDTTVTHETIVIEHDPSLSPEEQQAVIDAEVAKMEQRAMGAAHRAVADSRVEFSPEPPADTTARVTSPASGTGVTHNALAMLAPQARAITVLRHYDGKSPHVIASQLDLHADQVLKQLRQSHKVLRAMLKIDIPEEPDHVPADSGDSPGSHQIVVEPFPKSQ